MTLKGLLLLILSCTLIAAGAQSKTKRYNLRGVVVETKPATDEIVVQQPAIPGFMPAMTMPYTVKDPNALRDLMPGDAITAVVVSADDGKTYWLENIRITAKSFRSDTKPPESHRLNIGDPVPNLALVNQDGRRIRLTDFRGKALLITFIYTRCPLPNFCPLLSSQFSKIHDDLMKEPEVYQRTHLLTISFDPRYDTPRVLRKYGLAYLDNDKWGFGYWDFASANPEDLSKLASAFGLEYSEADNQISHTMVIALVGRDGTIAQYWGAQWTTAELEQALRRQASTETPSKSVPRKGAGT